MTDPVQTPTDPKLQDGGTPSQTDPNPSPQSPTPDPAAQQQTAQPDPNAKPAGTIYDKPDDSGTPAEPAAWRDEAVAAAKARLIASGMDEKEADKLAEKNKAYLGRYSSVTDALLANLEMRQKLSTGEYKKAGPPPENADPEAMKAWRAENGLPVDPSEYELPAVKGVDMSKLDDATKADIDFLRTGIHGLNLTKQQGEGVAQLLVALSEKKAEAEAAEMAQATAREMTMAEDTLRKEWGPDYRTNHAMNLAFFEKLFGDQTDAVLEARLPDGRKLGNLVEFSRAANALARQFKVSDVMYDGDKGQNVSIASRRAEIESIMKTDMNRYYREGLDKEYTRILGELENRGQL